MCEYNHGTYAAIPEYHRNLYFQNFHKTFETVRISYCSMSKSIRTLSNSVGNITTISPLLKRLMWVVQWDSSEHSIEYSNELICTLHNNNNIKRHILCSKRCIWGRFHLYIRAGGQSSEFITLGYTHISHMVYNM